MSAGHLACTPARMFDGLLAGTLLGLASAPHCVAMCGPLTAFAAVDARGVATPGASLRYQAGRALGYAALGGIAGGVGGGLASFLPFEAEGVFSFVLAATLAIAAARFWPRSSLVTLRRRPPSRMGARLGAAAGGLLSRVPRQPLALGIASALLPCGVLASGALLAAGSGGALSGALVMLGLAFGSGASLLAGSVVLGRVDLASNRRAAMAFSILLGIGAVVLASRPFLLGAHGACHAG
jgi:sulfite exporter TauE/SafE